MSQINAKVIGSIALGKSGVDLHTEYKMEVSFNDISWAVYRRYSEFQMFHDSLLSVYGTEQFAAFRIIFPGKSYTGASLGTLDFIAERRASGLSLFLRNLLQIQDIERNDTVVDFLDITHKGVSGLRRELVGEKVILESFVKMKHIKRTAGLWATYYVAVLSTGNVIVVPMLYDDSSKVITNMIVSNGGCEIQSIGLNNQILLVEKTTNVRLFLSLDSKDIAAEWLQTFNELSGLNVEQNVHVVNERNRELALQADMVRRDIIHRFFRRRQKNENRLRF